MKALTLLAVLAICPLAAIAGPRSSGALDDGDDRLLRWRTCRVATGLKDSDIKDAPYRNNGCLIDCVTSSGLVIPSSAGEEKECYQPGYRCLNGKCLGDAEFNQTKQKSEASETVRPKISVNSAHVRDLDQLPTTGESDVYVVIRFLDQDHPTLEADQIICHTWIIQDSDTPIWNNHSCGLMPMNRSARLEFAAYDSDKPRSVESDFLGSGVVTIDKLLKFGTYKLALRDERNRVLPGDFIEISASTL